MSAFLCFIFVIVAATSQLQKKNPASFCGCNMVRNYHAYDQPYDQPGDDCSYYCRSTTLSYYSKHMTKEIRVASVYDDAGNIDLTLCDGNTTNLTKPIILYLTSYDPINWVIDSDDDLILNHIVIHEIYVEYLRDDKGESTVTLNNTFIQSPNPKISIISGVWNGYGDDEDSNEILHNVKEKYNLELYSFCGGYNGAITLCVGEQDIVGNNYPNDNDYEECDIPLSTFAKNMLYVLGMFGFWCILCCGLACIVKQRRKYKKKKAEKQQMQRRQLEQDRRDKKRKEKLEMQRIRKKNENVYVGEEKEMETMKIKKKQYVENAREKNRNSLSDNELPGYNEEFAAKISRDNKNDEVISKEPTLSYSAMSCVICLDVLLENEATKLICGHKFHTHCIEEYNETNTNCPLCRKQIEY